MRDFDYDYFGFKARPCSVSASVASRLTGWSWTQPSVSDRIYFSQ